MTETITETTVEYLLIGGPRDGERVALSDDAVAEREPYVTYTILPPEPDDDPQVGGKISYLTYYQDRLRVEWPTDGLEERDATDLIFYRHDSLSTKEALQRLFDNYKPTNDNKENHHDI